MHEHADQADTLRQRLISLLQTDFTSPESKALVSEGEASGNALQALLGHVQPIGKFEARLASEENIQLGHEVEELVAAAPVTASFKVHIATAVRRAHAIEGEVTDGVAPDRLGLLSGDGIFDPHQAKDIEGQALRGYRYDLQSRLYALEDDGSSPLVLKPLVWPRGHAEEVERFEAWVADYTASYGEDPFEGIEPEAYRAAIERPNHGPNAGNDPL